MHRSLCIPPCRRRFLVFGLLFAQSVWAQVPAAVLPMSLEEARVQRAHAEVLMNEAQKRHVAAQEACYQKFLVNDCLEAARKSYNESMLKVRELDQAGAAVEREAHRRDVEAREAARAARQPQREAEQEAQAEHYRAEESGKAAARERKLADKARQAEEGRRKTAAEQAARSKKMEKRAKDDAERAAKKAARSDVKPDAADAR